MKIGGKMCYSEGGGSQTKR